MVKELYILYEKTDKKISYEEFLELKILDISQKTIERELEYQQNRNDLAKKYINLQDDYIKTLEEYNALLEKLKND